MKRTYSLIAAILTVSLLIYLFYRTERTLVNQLILAFVSPDKFVEMRASVIQAFPLSEPIVFSLPGALWVFCSTILSRDLYLKVVTYKIPMIAIPILFAMGLEICQLFRLTHGTFDGWDIGFYVIFWWLAYSGFQSPYSQQHPLSPFTLRGFMCLVTFLSVYLAHVN